MLPPSGYWLLAIGYWLLAIGYEPLAIWVVVHATRSLHADLRPIANSQQPVASSQ
jgi:hypothetical protein